MGARTTSIQTRVLEAEALALKLNESDLTYDEIAERLGVNSRVRAFQLVNNPLKRTISKHVEEYQALDFSRTEAMIEAVWPFATNDIDKALQYIGKGKDKQPLMCDPNDGEEHRHNESGQVCWVLPSQAMISGQQNVIKLLERRAKYGGLDHSDKMAERQVQLQEQQVELFAMGVRAVLDALDLTPEQKAREPEIVAKQLALVAGQAIDVTSSVKEDNAV